MTNSIRNIDELDFFAFGHGTDPTGVGEAPEHFFCRVGPISKSGPGTKLGCNLTIVPSGKRAYPLHNHRVNDEMFFVLAGTGLLRDPTGERPLRPGDVISCPAGGPETAHQIINTGNEDLRYLAISTRLSPEIVDYPDSGKFGISFLSPDGPGANFRYLGIAGESKHYWDGES